MLGGSKMYPIPNEDENNNINSDFLHPQLAGTGATNVLQTTEIWGDQHELITNFTEGNREVTFYPLITISTNTDNNRDLTNDSFILLRFDDFVNSSIDDTYFNWDRIENGQNIEELKKNIEPLSKELPAAGFEAAAGEEELAGEITFNTIKTLFDCTTLNESFVEISTDWDNLDIEEYSNKKYSLVNDDCNPNLENICKMINQIEILNSILKNNLGNFKNSAYYYNILEIDKFIPEVLSSCTELLWYIRRTSYSDFSQKFNNINLKIHEYNKFLNNIEFNTIESNNIKIEDIYTIVEEKLNGKNVLTNEIKGVEPEYLLIYIYDCIVMKIINIIFNIFGETNKIISSKC